MTDITERLRQWREACEQATEGPWVAERNEMDEATVGALSDPDMHGDGCLAVCGDGGDANAAFIAAAREAMPLLLDVAEAVARMREARRSQTNALTFEGKAGPMVTAVYDALDALAAPEAKS